MSDLRARLDALPDLAARSVWHDGRRAARHAHRAGSQSPPGVDLDRLDSGREQPHLLARLERCHRVVIEEAAGVHRLPLVAEVTTWRNAVDWLLVTMAWWESDDWCLEWITTEADAITAALAKTIAAEPERIECPTCGRTPDATTSDMLMVAMCDACDRVVAMRERLTPRQRRERTMASARALLGKILDAPERGA